MSVWIWVTYRLNYEFYPLENVLYIISILLDSKAVFLQKKESSLSQSGKLMFFDENPLKLMHSLIELINVCIGFSIKM